MTSLAPKHHLLILCTTLAALTLFLSLRAFSGNSLRHETKGNILANTTRSVERVYKVAKENAKKPVDEVTNRFLYLDRNPGMFKAVTEFFIRKGWGLSANLWLTIFLVNLGVIFQFLWVQRLFSSYAVAHLSTWFLLATPMMLFQGATIHYFPYAYCFSNLAIFAYLLYIKRPKWYLLTLAAASYLIVCQNYWMFYLSTALVLLGFTKTYKKRLVTKPLLAMYAMPVLAVGLHIHRVVVAKGGWSQGLKRMADIFVARTVDKRLPDSHWYPNQKFVSDKDWHHFWGIIDHRVQEMFLAPASSYLATLAIAFFISKRESRAMLRPFWYLIPAGLCWNLLFFQHTVIHAKSPTPGYILWMLIFAVTSVLFFQRLKSPHQTRLDLAKRCVAGVCLVVIGTKVLWRGIGDYYLGYFGV